MIGDWAGGEDWDGGRIVAAASAALYDEAVALLAAVTAARARPRLASQPRPRACSSTVR